MYHMISLLSVASISVVRAVDSVRKRLDMVGLKFLVLRLISRLLAKMLEFSIEDDYSVVFGAKFATKSYCL